MDAIRAASSANAPVRPSRALAEAPSLEVAESPTPSQPVTESVELTATDVAPTPMSTNPGNFVRIELFLNPEQIQGLLKDALGAQRSVLTVREVALMLRTTPHNVEKWAAEGKIPAFKLEDSWRFFKSSIEEWIALQARGEAA